jgi:mono/diheme cytochrome c family protein
MEFGLMKSNLGNVALLPAALAVSLALLAPAASQQAAAAPDNVPFDAKQLFATTCGWCHSSGGREAGKGPQLMNNPHDDEFLKNRIKNGKPGAMPAFGETFSDAQIDDIIKYIRSLKPT